MDLNGFRVLALNGGRVTAVTTPTETITCHLPALTRGYADAQLDDYGRVGVGGRRAFPWRPGVRLTLEACFSHGADRLLGTAGFGFWNAPFADPTMRWPALPQATWFFYGSAPTDLPLAATGPGRGWFAATLDAGTARALALAPFAPPLLLANQVGALHHRLWPRLWPHIRRQLGISFAPVAAPMDAWQTYELSWRRDGCDFRVNGRSLLAVPFSPRGPLGFVCWIDNQTMTLTADGRFHWGVLPIPEPQWMAVRGLQLTTLP